MVLKLTLYFGLVLMETFPVHHPSCCYIHAHTLNMCVHVCMYVYVCDVCVHVCKCAEADVWRSVDNLRSQSSPSTLFNRASYGLCVL